MRLVFHETAWADYRYWQDTDRKILKRINDLIKDCLRMPYQGVGKPMPLRGDLSGWWSRRITREPRLVYRIDGNDLQIAQCRFHYQRH